MSDGGNRGLKPGLMLFGATAEADTPLMRRLTALFQVHAEAAFSDALVWLQRESPAVVAVDLGGRAEAGVQAMEKLHRVHPELPLVALSHEKDPDLILMAMRAGAREFVLTGDEPELARVFDELARAAREGQSGGAILSVFPAKGGLGATTLAVNLAGSLLEGNKRVVLVDLDLQLGDALVFLDLVSRYSIGDVLANAHRLDGELLASSLTRHASGLFVLAQPEQIGEAPEPQAADVSRLLGFLAQHFDYVVCDGLRRFDERSLAALDASDRVLLLLAQNVPALRNAHRSLEVFRRLGYGASKVGLVINRFQKSEELGPQEVTQHLGLGITGMVANDYRTVSAAVNKGLLLRDAAPRARVTDDIRRLALTLSGPAHPKPGGGFLSALFGARNREGSRHGAERAAEAV